MKFTLPFLKKGQRVSAEIVEVLAEGMCIVNCNGDLIRIKNSTGRAFSPGESIKLQVTGLNPLSFRIAAGYGVHLDKSI